MLSPLRSFLAILFTAVAPLYVDSDGEWTDGSGNKTHTKKKRKGRPQDCEKQGTADPEGANSSVGTLNARTGWDIPSTQQLWTGFFKAQADASRANIKAIFRAGRLDSFRLLVQTLFQNNNWPGDQEFGKACKSRNQFLKFTLNEGWIPATGVKYGMWTKQANTFCSFVTKSPSYLAGVEEYVARGNNRLLFIYTDDAEERFVNDHMDVITWQQVGHKKSLIDSGIDPSTSVSLANEMGFGEQASKNASAAKMKDEEDKKAEKEKKKAEQDEKAAKRSSARKKKDVNYDEKEETEEKIVELSQHELEDGTKIMMDNDGVCYTFDGETIGVWDEKDNTVILEAVDELLADKKTYTRKVLVEMFRKLEEKFYDKMIEIEGPGVQNMEDEYTKYVSQLDNLKKEVNHLKRAKYRELKNMSADDEVTEEMLAETTEAQLFPMASQFADEDMSEDDDTTEGTGEEASQESGAKEE
jgi:hypothetical protein